MKRPRGRRRPGHRSGGHQQPARLPGPYRHRAGGLRCCGTARWTIPAARPAEGNTPVEDLCGCGSIAPISARVHGPGDSRRPRRAEPRWLAKRLATIGIAAINNVVDVSNYVMMECGQPLHTFDYAKLPGPEIIVRRPLAGRDDRGHRPQDLPPRSGHVRDRRRRRAGGHRRRDGRGGHGGHGRTRDVLVEAADFDPISIRTTARRLGLHSDSSYRFERRVDPGGPRLGQPPLLPS